ncbi:DUF3159 domain-containing protein [Pseudonocardia spinosispora]|uniref:DUF3159 domain-containing protein n=1 Tax=Pseudonocardia spinosispora TaxID=103441 RepID=UPI00048F5192|nr:DUF3159 domain-containing protein [Pseudonocardia spinosispora]
MTGRHTRQDSSPATASETETETAAPPTPTILEQMGGIPGMIYSAVPVVVFVLVNSVSSLTPALIAAIGVAVAIAVWRLIRKEPLQPAVSGLFGVGIGALIAYRSGEARDFFLLGIWYSGLLAVVFLGSVLIRWPLAGVIWHGINGDGQGWRADRDLRKAYTFATLLWGFMFAVKFGAQHWLYDANQPGWLAVARIGGYALTALALLGTFWAVRRAQHRSAEAQPV